MAINNAVNVTLTGQSGTGAFAGTTSPSFVAPFLGTPASGNLTNCTNLPIASLSASGARSSTTYLRGDNTWSSIPASGVTAAIGTPNQVNVSNPTGAVTFSLPQNIATTSSVQFDSVSFSNTAHGIVGCTTNNNASSGYVGEYISAIVSSGSSLNLTSGSMVNLCSVSLTSGDWDVWGEFWLTGAALTLVSKISAAISTTSGGPSFSPSDSIAAISNQVSLASLNVGPAVYPLNPCRTLLASATTVYLTVSAAFTLSTAAAYGKLCARRVR